MTTTPTATAVRFGRLERRGVILGLTAGQVGLVASALLVVVGAEYTTGMAGLVVSSPLWLCLAAVGLASVRGRPLVAWLPVMGEWSVRRLLRGHVEIARPLQQPPTASLTLPGIVGRLTVIKSPATGAAVVFDPRSGTATVVLAVQGCGFIFEDPATQDALVSDWGRLLAGLCQQGDVARVQILHRRSVGGTSRVRKWWAENGLVDAPWAARVVAELIADADTATERHEWFIAVALRTSIGSKPSRAAGLGSVDQQATAIASAVTAAGIGLRGWVTPTRLRRVLRCAYDPTALPDEVREAGEDALRTFIGPMGFAETWDSVCTDNVHHAVYWISEWPRSDAHPGFLQPLLLASGAQRSFSLLVEPISAATALRDIRRAKVEHTADATQRARIGRIEDESTRAEAADLIRREQDLVAGHGDFRFAGLVAVTAHSHEELEEACRATETAAAQSMCDLRRLVGQQGLAHAAATLPLARSLL
ncbi:MAG: hypothetical protein LCI03_01010 [Actinobacteria bacterium]|nr:hypothetical protein [Actinomycetota bacterium]